MVVNNESFSCSENFCCMSLTSMRVESEEEEEVMHRAAPSPPLPLSPSLPSSSTSDRHSVVYVSDDSDSLDSEDDDDDDDSDWFGVEPPAKRSKNNRSIEPVKEEAVEEAADTISPPSLVQTDSDDDGHSDNADVRDNEDMVRSNTANFFH
jgi:hypothetical protein